MASGKMRARIPATRRGVPIAWQVAFLIGSRALLLALRRHRGAQIASRWLRLLCTVVVFRRATYDSPFFT